MDKEKLQKAYEAIEMLKALDLPVSKEQIEQISQLEALYLQENIIPLVECTLEPMVKDLRRDFRMEILYSPQDGLLINCGKQIKVKQRKQEPTTAKSHEAPVNHPKKKYIMKVTFRDGFSVCHSSVAQTFIEAIERIGVEEVLSINQIAFNGTLIIEDVDRAIEMLDRGMSLKQLPDGSYINVNTNTMTKMRQLGTISDILQLGLKIDKVWL